ncbi:tetratricopeptide repeat protein [bacterium]|nr:tetratricopeptide repeat protein [bacterium]
MAISFFYGTSWAQIRFEPPVPQKQTSALEVQLQRNARRAEIRGDFDAALRYYIQLSESFPQNDAYYKGILQCLMELRRYEEAAALVKDRISKTASESGNPLTIQNLLVDLGTVYLSWGDDTEAWRQWEQAVAVNPDNTDVYRGISASLMRARMVDKAVEILKRGKTASGGLFLSLDLANAYTALMDYKNAVSEYLNYLSLNPNHFNIVERSIYNFPQSEETTEQVVSVLLEYDESPEAQKLLAGYYFSLGRYEEALEYIILTDFHGKELLEFANSLISEGHWDLALKAYQTLNQKFPESPFTASVLTGMAYCYSNMGHFDNAISIYGAISQKYRLSTHCETAFYRLGVIYYDDLFQIERAESCFVEVLEKFPRGKYNLPAKFALGRCAVGKGDLSAAKTAFYRLLNAGSALDREYRSSAQLWLGKCMLWKNKPDSALYIWDILVRENPLAEAANDALDEIIMLKDIPENPVIADYAAAEYAMYRRQYETAVEGFRNVMSQMPESIISGRAVLNLSDIIIVTAGADSAADILIEYDTEHHESPIRDRILLKTAEILQNEIGDVDRALEYYEKILIEIPESALAPLVRSRMNNIRKIS